MECSALKNEGVDSIFEAATRAAMLVRTPNSNPAAQPPRKSGDKRNGYAKEQPEEQTANRCCVLC